jgi:hypothetical protein
MSDERRSMEYGVRSKEKRRRMKKKVKELTLSNLEL